MYSACKFMHVANTPCPCFRRNPSESARNSVRLRPRENHAMTLGIDGTDWMTTTQAVNISLRRLISTSRRVEAMMLTTNPPRRENRCSGEGTIGTSGLSESQMPMPS